MAIDLCGQRFGRLVVACKDGSYTSPSGYTEPKWKCICDCGNPIIVSSRIRNGWEPEKAFFTPTDRRCVNE